MKIFKMKSVKKASYRKTLRTASVPPSTLNAVIDFDNLIEGTNFFIYVNFYQFFINVNSS